MQFNIWILLFGIAFITLGSLHLIPRISSLDTRIFESLHRKLRPKQGFFCYIWPLGTTPVALVLIALALIPGWQVGTIAALLYAVIAGVERIIKIKLKRPRPFETIGDTAVGQPTRPKDASHPSGDAMRVWFLAIIIPTAFNLPWPVWALTCGVALTLSLGRIALGVHYPLDVIGGSGLGLTAAAITLLAAG